MVPGFSASPIQSALWARITRSHPDAPSPRCESSWTLRGTWDVERLREALASVVERHEALRTVVRAAAARTEPVQSVAEVSADLLEVIDLSDRCEAVDADEALRAARAAWSSAVAGSYSATLRALLLVRSADSAQFVLNADVLSADRLTLGLVAQEVALSLAGEEPGGEVIQYPEVAAWGRELLTDEDSAEDRAHWAALLEPARGWATAHRPVGTRTDPAAPGYTAHLDAGRTARIAALATARETSVQAVLGAAWTVAAARLAGGPVPLAVTHDGRAFDTVRKAAGPFERPMPAVVDALAAPSFHAVVDELTAQWTRGGDLIDHLDARRFDELMDEGLWAGFTAVPASPVLDHGTADWHPLDARVLCLARTLTCTEAADAVTWQLAYSGGDMAAVPAEAVLPAFVTALDALVAAPGEPPADCPLTAAGDPGSVLVGPAADTTARDLAEAVALAAGRVPDAEAVRCGDDHLTYAALDALANRWARRLADAGVNPGDRVVLDLERGAAVPAIVIGVLRAGAVFVPYDPTHPDERLRYMLDDTAAAAVITRRGLGTDVRPVVLAPDDERVAGLPYTDPQVRRAPSDPAYVLYTSGTTGRPKGVVVPWSALNNYLTWAAATYRLAEGKGSLVHSSLAFDFSLTALLAPLTVGGRVLLLPPGAGPYGLATALRSCTDLSLLKLTPTHLDALQRLTGGTEWAHRVRTLVIGGEQLHAESLSALRSLPGLRIFNEYGPTETVVGSTAHRVGTTTPVRGRVPIGRPVAGTVITVRDRRGRPVPAGVPGEICIGGAGLADGYLGQETATRERFVTDTHGPRPGQTHYRTGDLGRLLPDGELEYVGRLDDQLKVRGVRVEPDEVRSVLLDHPAVARVAVVARAARESSAESRLVAYVVPAAAAGTAPVHPAGLVEHARRFLPDVMVPVVLLVDALPTTVNGKLDTDALPDPDRDLLTARPYVAPRDTTEEVLTSVIAEVLGLERVGIDDDYLALGGDSIRSVMIAARAAHRGVGVGVAQLHEHATVRHMAAALVERPGTTSSAARPSEPFSLVSAEDRALMPEDVEDAFPLSLLQEGMIFHRDFAAKSAVYHAIASVRLEAPFDLAAFDTVIRGLVERHPMLRTSFDMSTFSRPLQLVHRTFDTPLFHEDLRRLDAEEQQAHVRRWVEGEQERGFELHDYPLIRFMVQRLSDDEFQFTYGFHHEIVDGWSEALMITEIFDHYFSLVYDEPIELRAPVASMRDAVALELEALEDRGKYDFWDTYLSDASLMRLPRMGVGQTADKGAREIVRLTVPIAPELSDALKALAREEGVPLKTVLMAGHMRVMSAYGGHTDTLSYTVTNGRPEDTDGSTAIGLFVNSLAHRVAMPGGSWRDLIAASLASERATMPHRRLPMAELKRHQGNEPLAETLFFFTDYHIFRGLDRWRARGVRHVADELYGESTFPFCGIFRLGRDTGDLEVRIEYDGLQFSAGLMDSVSDAYVEVLTAMAGDPDGRYDARDFLSEADRSTLEALRGPELPAVEERCLHELFEERARSQPDAIAVQWLGGSISYAALDWRATALARTLRAHGVGAEVPVGILAERSAEQIVAMLGILKAGGAYVPLDPALPEARTASVVAESGTRLVVAQQARADMVPAGPAVLTLDPLGRVGSVPEPTGTRPAPRPTPGSAAYVLFTSGSTGVPKGVVVEHRNVVASLRARTLAYPDPVDRFLLLSSYAFDSSVAGIFWTLTEGGTLVLPSEGAQLEPLDVLDQLARERVTHTLAIPSLLLPVLEEAGDGELDALRVVTAAGEPCPSVLGDVALDRIAGATVHNEYGPTEATVWSTVWTGTSRTGRPHMPIGRPIAGTRARVVNPYGHNVPVGVAGALLVAGTGVVRGYLGRPGATADAFRPDPYALTAGERVYVTGDVARCLSGGDLEFVGRDDQQVKIRGFRVELSELEAVLDAHPDVQKSVVVAHRSDSGSTELTAHVVVQPGVSLDAVRVQQFVRDRLPRYMIPAHCTILDAVPLTATGKVDRAALPAPSTAKRPDAPHVEPATESERIVAAVWCRVLGLERVSARAAFFDLGGESLRAMQVTTAVNKALGTRITVRALFDAATLAEFAAVVDAARRGEGPVARGIAAASAEATGR
ncbi:amino acid adenylation domain-containing protein [Kitasatospora sp. NPDC101235]|uniref:amino acid adenylation domain-containing protein n=1 Tax=Kitasatospora sp. NPDC101235 TaxID=3364101 RepID=UPI00382DF74F